MPHILMIATGGTIASRAAAEGGPVTAQLGGPDLLAGVDLPEGVEVTVRGFASLGSYALTLADLHDLAALLASEMADYDGVVITHGTDTMEETAFALELLLAPPIPVILTGAQRHAGQADTDGPRNLRDAILAAATPALGAAGVAILFEGDLHAARHVRKSHTSRVDTFRSGDFGKIGSVDVGRIDLRHLPQRLAPLGLDAAPQEVALISAAMGMGPELLHFALGHPYRAVILEGFGRGNFPQGWAEATAALTAAGKPVIVTSRCPEGAVRPIYGKDSGGTSMAAAGAIFAGDLAGNKARILLAFLLGHPSLDAETEFERYCA